MNAFIEQELSEHCDVIKALGSLTRDIADAARLCSAALDRGGRIYLCGNGGSAGDAQHIAAELIGRLIHDRKSLPAVALTTDTSALTAIANDYGYDHVFARQVEGLLSPGDVLIAISTSGNSANVLNAVDTAFEKGGTVVALSGKDGGELARRVDGCITVPSQTTARIQECHILIGHILCGLIESELGLRQ
ncbi:phosphoheptose isomerase [Luminiphilus syltensis NOR5-1B]|uniref:Phosphoheptose isomerase n=1 Tax=Luminiphilus syltensis NOR5-1B TaxID=565045 RepID=B8KYP1_9GAMM|nr:D-sedoheptulose 7-phosphate isomerase [Luminiphilus syltensis]EED35185.1 phosphoheptose isomerase [Luminiphilus syltensis NOR5-1B]